MHLLNSSRISPPLPISNKSHMHNFSHKDRFLDKKYKEFQIIVPDEYLPDSGSGLVVETSTHTPVTELGGSLYNPK